MRLSAKDWSNLVDTLKHADHDLFIELRTLSKICRSAEVIDFEDICAAFRGRCDDLRRLDFREALIVERPAETRHNGCTQAEYRSPHHMPVANDRMVEQGGLSCLDFSFTERERRWLLDRDDHLNNDSLQLQSPGSLG